MLSHKEKIDQSTRGFCKYGDYLNLKIGEKYTFEIKNNQIIIQKSDMQNTKKSIKENTVSVKKLKSGHYPLIDIRTKEVKEFMSTMSDIELEVYEDQIIVSGMPKEETGIENNKCKEQVSSFKEKVFDLLDATKQRLNRFTNRITNKKKTTYNSYNNVIQLEELRTKNKRVHIVVSQDEFKEAVGEMYQQLSIFDTFADEPVSVQKRFTRTVNKFVKLLKKIGLEVSSLYSGTGMFNKPFLDAGFKMDFALEINKAAAENYKKNISKDGMVEADIMKYDLNKIKKNPIMLISNPCTAFTKENRSKTKWEEHPDYKLIDRTLDAIEANEEAQVVIWENVVEMFTAFGGAVLKQIKKRLKSFKDKTFGKLFAPDFGSAQNRMRGFMILSKIGKIDLPEPTVKPENYKTIRQAFEGIHEDMPNQKDHSNSFAITKERMKYIPQGGNWTFIPEHLRTERMKGEGRHGNSYYRYDYDSQASSIVCDRKEVKFHPTEQRGLTIREILRLFGMPDDFVLFGNLGDMQQQTANGVDYHPAYAIAIKVLTHIMHVNQQNGFNQLVTV